MKTAPVIFLLWCAIVHAAVVNVAADSNIQAAVDANPAGTVFQLAAGVYRMQTVTPKNGDQFTGALDAAGHRLTRMSGAQQLTSFTQDAFGNYVATTTQTQPGQQNGYCAAGYPNCALPEDFFYDDVPYFNSGVAGAALSPGQYYFDYPDGLIYFRPVNPGDDPTRHRVEYSRTPAAFSGGASNVTVSNLIVEKYAVPLQFGAIGDQYPGEGWVLVNNETRLNHGAGMIVVGNAQVLNNYSHDNGQLGMAGSGLNVLVQGNEIARNNYAGIDHNFDCGGLKFAYSDTLTVSNNYVHDNIGPGMWTDISSIRTLYDDNKIMNNTGAGIVHETSYDAVIRNNTIFNNGSYAPPDWFWNAGIQIAASQNVEVYGSVVMVNSETNGNGIMLIQQNRSTEPCLYGPCVVINNFVHDNTIIVTGTGWQGSTGGVEDYTGQGDMFAYTANNLFAGNAYYATDLLSTVYWEWAGNYQTFVEFQACGQDVSGSLNQN